MRLRYPNDRPTKVTISVPLPPGTDDGDGDVEWTHQVLASALADAEGTLADLIGPDGQGTRVDTPGAYQVDHDAQGAWLTVTGTVR